MSAGGCDIARDLYCILFVFSYHLLAVVFHWLFLFCTILFVFFVIGLEPVLVDINIIGSAYSSSCLFFSLFLCIHVLQYGDKDEECSLAVFFCQLNSSVRFVVSFCRTLSYAGYCWLCQTLSTTNLVWASGSLRLAPIISCTKLFRQYINHTWQQRETLALLYLISNWKRGNRHSDPYCC